MRFLVQIGATHPDGWRPREWAESPRELACAVAAKAKPSGGVVRIFLSYPGAPTHENGAPIAVHAFDCETAKERTPHA